MIAIAKPKRKRGKILGLKSKVSVSRSGRDSGSANEQTDAATKSKRRSGDLCRDAEQNAAATARTSSATRVMVKPIVTLSRVGGEGEGRSVNEGFVATRRKFKRTTGEVPSFSESLGASSAKTKARSAECDSDSVRLTGKRAKSNGRSILVTPTKAGVNGQGGSGGDRCHESESGHAATCRQLMELQRRRIGALRERIRADNGLAALVSTELGYHAGLEEAGRKLLRSKAESLIAMMDDGDEIPADLVVVASRVSAIVASARLGRNGFDAYLKSIEKEMVGLVKQLSPEVVAWCESVRGFGMKSLAVIVVISL